MPKRSRDVPPEFEHHRRDLALAMGDRIRQRRKGLGLTQTELRARLELYAVYVTQAQFSRIENGELLADAAEVKALASALDVPCGWMLFEHEELGEHNDGSERYPDPS